MIVLDEARQEKARGRGSPRQEKGQTMKKESRSVFNGRNGPPSIVWSEPRGSSEEEPELERFLEITTRAKKKTESHPASPSKERSGWCSRHGSKKTEGSACAEKGNVRMPTSQRKGILKDLAGKLGKEVGCAAGEADGESSKIKNQLGCL